MENSQRKIFERQRDTLKRKAGELSSLCDVDVCLLCVGPAGDLASWPEDPAAARSIVEKYDEATNRDNSKRRRKDVTKTTGNPTAEPGPGDGDGDRDGSLSQLLAMSEDSLLWLSRCLECKIQGVNGRIEFLNAKQASQQEEMSQVVNWVSQPDLWGPTEQQDTGSPTFDQTICNDCPFLSEISWTDLMSCTLPEC